MINLTSLKLSANENITDIGIKYMVNLTSLSVGNNHNITGNGIKHLINLTCNIDYETTDDIHN